MFSLAMFSSMNHKEQAMKCYRLAKLWASFDNIEEAMSSCKIAFMHDPFFYPSSTFHGFLCAKEGQWNKAKEHFQVAHSLAKNSPVEAFNLANAYFQSTPRELDKALECYNKALALYHQHSQQFELIICPIDKIKEIDPRKKKSGVMVLIKMQSADEWRLVQFDEDYLKIDSEYMEAAPIDEIPTLQTLLDSHKNVELDKLRESDVAALTRPIKTWLENKDIPVLQNRAILFLELKDYEAALKDFEVIHEKLSVLATNPAGLIYITKEIAQTRQKLDEKQAEDRKEEHKDVKTELTGESRFFTAEKRQREDPPDKDDSDADKRSRASGSFHFSV